MAVFDGLVGKTIRKVEATTYKYRQRKFPGNDVSRTTGIVITFTDGSELKVRPEADENDGRTFEYLVMN